MLLSIIVGTVDAQLPGIAFQANYYGTKNVACKISRDALLDLAGYHQMRGSALELVQALRPEIERILSAKYRARRVETNGEIWIAPPVLLLYGFEGRAEPADDFATSRPPELAAARARTDPHEAQGS
jgi:hypothetical protein